MSNISVKTLTASILLLMFIGFAITAGYTFKIVQLSKHNLQLIESESIKQLNLYHEIENKYNTAEKIFLLSLLNNDSSGIPKIKRLLKEIIVLINNNLERSKLSKDDAQYLSLIQKHIQNQLNKVFGNATDIYSLHTDEQTFASINEVDKIINILTINKVKETSFNVEVLHNKINKAKVILVILYLMLFAFSIASFYITKEYLLDPLQEVADAINEFKKGKLQFRFKVIRNNEIGKLKRDINEMDPVNFLSQFSSR
ncbi:HAMP domain-containing protein [Hippea jasoniae]|uniref:HAMP domain-containing protein n=1 Tax=Hippea jasoniae TaxID=944479 RepID=UPI0005582459|nr:HAMP domain-containing protein [Hippea jasoniae]